MAPSPFFVLFVLSRLVLSHSADERKYLSQCPPFACGKLGEISFPFSNTSHPECGLCQVNNCNKPVQKIQLQKGGNWYEVKNISQAGSIFIDDHELQRQLKSSNCGAFNYFTLPSFPYFFLKITPNITLFKCNRNLKSTFHADFNYTGCKDYNIYYNHLNNSPPILPSQCSVIQLPVIENPREADYNDLFTLMRSDFNIETHVSGDCYSCYGRGGQCQRDTMGRFRCAGAKLGKGRFPWKLAIGLGSGVPILLIICLFLFVRRCRYRRKYASSNLLSANNSCSPSSKSGLERDSIYFGVLIFTYSELEEATNNFDPTKELGDGGFGTVYYGKLRDGREVAVKRLYKNNYKRVEQFMNEIQIITRLRHQNLVTLYGCTSRHSHELLLVYEFIPNGTVADHLHGDRVTPCSLTWPIRLRIAIETASALAYLHASDIIHRDVKTNNILLDNNFCVKVADFGLSRLFPTDVTHISTAPQGTPGYVDPEYHQCYQLTEKSDVYSFGVVLIELISSMPAVDICRHRHEINLANLAINKIQNRVFNELVDPCLGFESDLAVRRMTISVAELAFRCLQLDRDMRPSMDEVLKVLRSIESVELDVKKTEELNDKVGALTSVLPLPSPDADEIVLLKNMQPPTSPDSVTDKWFSRSTTPTVSG